LPLIQILTPGGLQLVYYTLDCTLLSAAVPYFITCLLAPAGPGKFDLVYDNPDGSERVEYAVTHGSQVLNVLLKKSAFKLQFTFPQVIQDVDFSSFHGTDLKKIWHYITNSTMNPLQ